jgi:hypothetical protein
MAYQILQATLTVTNLAAGASTTVPHTLINNGLRLVPTIIWPDRPTAIGVVSADNTNVTFRNTGLVAQTAVFLVQWDHSIQQAAVAPIQIYWQGGANGASGSSFLPYLFSNSSTQDTEVYVDSTSGSDTNDGLTPATALQTINAVYTKFPMFVFAGATMTVNLAAGAANTVANYPCRSLVVNGGSGALAAYRFRGPQMVPATLASGPTTVVGGLTASVPAGTRRTQIVAVPNPGWTVNNLQGSFLRVTRGGVKVFFELPICENTADTIFVDILNIVGVIQATDTIEIVTPGARITSDSALGEVFITGNAGYLPSSAYWGGSPTSVFERIRISGFPLSMNVGGLAFDRCRIDNFPFWKGGSVAHVNCIYPNGVKLGCMSLEVPISSRPDAVGNPINTSVSMELAAFDLFLVGNPDASAQYYCKRAMSVYNQTQVTRGAIHVFGMGSWFFADDGSGTVGGTVALNGANNAGPFIWCVFGGQARINSTVTAPSFTLGTGTGNPLRVGVGAANPAIPYGNGAGAFQEAAGFNGNFHRMAAGTAAAPTGDASRIFFPLT